MIKGIDVSRWQGVIDWDKVKSGDTKFAIIKSSGGDSGLYPDGQFTRNKAEARRVGLSHGFYHFAGGVHDPVEEADHFVNTVGDLQAGENLVLDWEVPHANPVEWCRKFAQRVIDRVGIPPLIYMNLSTVRAHDWKPLVDLNCGLWVAAWGNNDQVPAESEQPGSGQWPFWAIWQYSSNGIVDGISGRVDLDLFNGDVEAFEKYGVKGEKPVTPAPTPPPAPQPPKYDEYTVQAGDSLSGIASRYNMSWQALYAINTDRIADPNRIFPGQKLRVPTGGPVQTKPNEPTYYTVKSGDTLSSIGAQFGTNWKTIYDWNRAVIGPDPNFIKPGQKLRVK